MKTPSFANAHRVLLIGILATTISTAQAWLIPFSEDRIKAAGKNCVHGFEGNFGETTIYYAGTTADLNESLSSHGSEFAKVLIMIHSGSMVLPDYLDSKGTTATDWSIQYTPFPEEEDGLKHTLRIDIWLGANIKLEDLRIPKNFEAQSGKEIEKFVSQHEKKREQNVQLKDPPQSESQ